MTPPPDTDPEARTGTVERPGVAVSWDSVRGFGAAFTMVVVIGGFVWALAAQAENVAANTAAVRELDCLPVQVARVEERVTAVSAQITAQQALLETILLGVQREKAD
jgi:hypothetical protein